MADPPRGAQPGFPRHRGGHQLVGVQAPLHQRFGPAGADELDRLRRRIMAVLGIDDFETGNVQTRFRRNLANLRNRTHQDRDDQLEPCRLDRALQRDLVARMRDRRRHRRMALRCLQQCSNFSCRRLSVNCIKVSDICQIHPAGIYRYPTSRLGAASSSISPDVVAREGNLERELRAQVGAAVAVIVGSLAPQQLETRQMRSAGFHSRFPDAYSPLRKAPASWKLVFSTSVKLYPNAELRLSDHCRST